MRMFSAFAAMLTGTRARVVTATLCVSVSLIHVLDQGGFPGDKTPRYVGIGYYLLEAGGLVCAALLLLARRFRAWSVPWWFAAGVAVGPLAGYILSRGPGLPAYTDDRGNWSEPLGVASLIVESSLLISAVAGLLASRSAALRKDQD